MYQPHRSETDDPHQRKMFLITHQFRCTAVAMVNCKEVQHSCQSAKNSRATLYNLIRSSACRTIFTLMMTTLSNSPHMCMCHSPPGSKYVVSEKFQLHLPALYVPLCTLYMLFVISLINFSIFFLDFIDYHGLLFRSRSANKENFLLISFGNNCSSHMLSKRGSSDNTNKLPQTKNLCNRAVGET